MENKKNQNKNKNKKIFHLNKYKKKTDFQVLIQLFQN